MATIVNLFLDSTEFSGATAVYTDIDLTIKAPDGYYVYGTLNRRQLDGLLQTGVECSTIEPCQDPVDCVVSDWSDWSACIGGSQTRTRTIIIPASGGGTPCPTLEETRTCETPVNCVVSDWSDWSTCVGGSQTRTRSIITPASGGGTPCPTLEETRTCALTYNGVLYDFTGISNPQIFSIQEFGPFGGYERITLLNGSIINEYNWAPTIECGDTPVSTVTITEPSKTFAKYAIWNDITVQVVGEFWMDATTPTDRATWQSASTKKYSPFTIC